MKQKIICFASFVLFVFGSSVSYGQEAVVPSGTEATGSGGTVSSTIGQVVYTEQTGSGGTVAQGVQQVYDISSSGIGFNEVELSYEIYPNPTQNQITLSLGNLDHQKMTYQILDINGKIVKSGSIINSTTKIDLSAFESAVYFLKVIDNKEEIKSFKIVKN